ncbi:MAG TPA: NifU family protein [Thermomicrobiales bacterium]|nr:NifU family protein [Thermomicrobiales bacterium]
MDDREVRERVAGLEALLAEVETLPDPRARDTAAAVVQTLLEVYGEGLVRLLAVATAGEGRERVLAACAGDELLTHLLLLHGLHPESLEARVGRALDEVRPYLASHGGGVELVALEDGVARLRLRGSCHGCPSSTATLELAIEEAIRRRAPDLERIEAEGVAEPPPPPAAFIPLAGLRRREHPLMAAEERDHWSVAGTLAPLAGGGLLEQEVAGAPVLFLKVAGDFFAYRPDCPGCGAALAGGALAGAELTCPGCGRRYDVRRAGRCLDGPERHLEPLPLLVSAQGLVKVALPSASAVG